ncbi:MAG TPA: hypothetical protein DDY71_15705 [Spirochaetia bacterium]|nr:MAG: hypothetical protein A2Y29_04780 [Spirochaetes bacterium GWE2_31_10]HBD94759.1 hypothetical protein [Spirochaetia bacterium]HBI39087.1 hypothetical protein [Spirochaetia bacterium]
MKKKIFLLSICIFFLSCDLKNNNIEINTTSQTSHFENNDEESFISVYQGNTFMYPSENNLIDTFTINDTTVDIVFTIVNRGALPLKMTGDKIVDLSSDVFYVTKQPTINTLNKEESIDFIISFYPKEVKSYFATITIQNDSNNETPLIFTIVAKGILPIGPEINLKDNSEMGVNNNSTYSFSKTRIIEPVSIQLTLENTGSDILIFKNNPFIDLSGDCFSLFYEDNLSYLEIGEQLKFNVIFLPKEAKNYSGKLTILTNDLNESTYIINLLGTGTKDEDYYYTGYNNVSMGTDKVYAHACYWKNQKMIELDTSNADSFAKSIIVENNNIYVCGEYNNFPCFWKNGERTDLFLPYKNDFAFYTAETIKYNKENIYIAGSRYDSKTRRACFWKNGELNDLSTDIPGQDRITSAMTIVNDSLYFSGNFFDENEGKNLACYWKDQNFHPLESNINSETYDIAINNEKVYVVGYYSNSQYNHIACFWENGNRFTLYSTEDSYAKSIFIEGDIIYIAGQIRYNHDNFSNPVDLYRPCYWENSTGQFVLHYLDYLSNANANIKKIFVYNDIVYIGGSEWLYGDKYGYIWKYNNILSLSEVDDYLYNDIFINY